MKEHEPIGGYTTFGIGGTAQYFVSVKSRDELVDAVRHAERSHMPYWLLAGGSNLVCADHEIMGLCIHVASAELKRNAQTFTCDAGVPLATLVDAAADAGLSGLESLSGIPGTVGGAVVGNAGAYGQTISGPLVRVEIYDAGIVRWISKAECEFSYRDSLFKSKQWILLRAEFALEKGDSAALKAKGREIVALREKKYPPGIKCPGSFFKNMLLEKLPEATRSMIPETRDFYGKVPAWFFLNEVGARGMRRGGVRVADIHGNLIVNDGSATYEDVVGLARELKVRVKDRFGVDLEEEVRYVE